MIPFRNRFHGHGSLRYVYKNGRTARSRLMTIKSVPNKRRKTPRMAVVVSKKVYKGAVGRNRMRRRVYEIIRRECEYIKQDTDIVIIISSSELMTISSKELEAMIRHLFKDLEIYK